MVGACLGGAKARIPIVLDGVISQVAALVATRMEPETRNCLIASHASKEPASRLILEELQLSPVIDAGMALGEGCGAVMFFPLLDLALEVYRQNRTFADIEIEAYHRWDEG